jgi:hypothetical protein
MAVFMHAGRRPACLWTGVPAGVLFADWRESSCQQAPWRPSEGCAGEKLLRKGTKWNRTLRGRGVAPVEHSVPWNRSGTDGP